MNAENVDFDALFSAIAVMDDQFTTRDLLNMREVRVAHRSYENDPDLLPTVRMFMADNHIKLGVREVDAHDDPALVMWERVAE
jgi:hypothetical protein